MRGKGTKLSEGRPKVRLSQDRTAIFGIFTFGIVTLLCFLSGFLRSGLFRSGKANLT